MLMVNYLLHLTEIMKTKRAIPELSYTAVIMLTAAHSYIKYN